VTLTLHTITDFIYLLIYNLCKIVAQQAQNKGCFHW